MQFSIFAFFNMPFSSMFPNSFPANNQKPKIKTRHFGLFLSHFFHSSEYGFYADFCDGIGSFSSCIANEKANNFSVSSSSSGVYLSSFPLFSTFSFHFLESAKNRTEPQGHMYRFYIQVLLQ